jgi:broad specificity phosphatase PhoE
MSGINSSSRPTLILVRHALTEMAGRFCGHLDLPLSVIGLAQVSDVCERLSGYRLTHVFSSDLKRARQTAESIANSRELPVHALASLREIAFGSWEGLTWDEAAARDPEYAQRWADQYPSMPAPGGEELQNFRRRIESAMDEIAEQARGGCAAVVTHAGVIRTLTGNLTRGSSDFKCDYGACFEVRREREQWTVVQEVAPHSAARETPLVISD